MATTQYSTGNKAVDSSVVVASSTGSAAGAGAEAWFRPIQYAPLPTTTFVIAATRKARWMPIAGIR